MNPAMLIPLISGGVDLIVKLVDVYNSQPDADADIKAELDKIRASLDETLAKVNAYTPKDV